MKYLRKFDSVEAMNTVLASATIDILGLAYNGSTPVFKNKTSSSPVPPTPSYSTPFYVENITQEEETLYIQQLWGEYGGIDIPVEYSTDGTSWSSLGTTGDEALSMTLQPSDKVYLRSTTTAWASWDSGFGSINFMAGFSKVGGNIMSLLYGSNFTGNETTFPSGSTYTFAQLFSDNTQLVDASDLLLPATTLADYCYDCMFDGCTALTTAPTLPATTLTDSCYHGMFSDCRALTTAPALPATTLAQNCYDYMFNGCIYLTTAPELPATVLVDYCYNYMFQNCTSLNYIKCLATNKSATDCTNQWVSGVASTGTFVKNPSMSTSTWGTGTSGIPSGWTVEDATA